MKTFVFSLLSPPPVAVLMRLPLQLLILLLKRYVYAHHIQDKVLLLLITMHHIAFDSPNAAGPASPGFATIQVSS